MSRARLLCKAFFNSLVSAAIKNVYVDVLYVEKQDLKLSVSYINLKYYNSLTIVNTSTIITLLFFL